MVGSCPLTIFPSPPLRSSSQKVIVNTRVFSFLITPTMSGSRVAVSHRDILPHPHTGQIDQPQICFTRQLWQRTMSVDQNSVSSPSASLARVSIGSSIAPTRQSTARSASVASIMSAPLQSMNSPHTPTRTIGSDQQSPSSSPRKRPVDQIEETEQTALSSPRSTVEASPYPCLCQPEPKIPRPRNGE